MHPIEHLRYVAGARGADATSLVQETASAIGALGADQANLVIVCRRILEHHLGVGPMWWLCARLLTAQNPSSLAWTIADEIADDPAHRSIADAIGGDATVATVGWPATAGSAILLRGDTRVLCADAEFEASAFLQHLERFEFECEPVPAESLAHALGAADIALIDASAASSGRVLAPLGSQMLAAIARSVGTPVWLTVGLGRRLPEQYVDAIADHVFDESDDWHVGLDDVPLELIDSVASVEGVSDAVSANLRSDCAFAPELLRLGAK